MYLSRMGAAGSCPRTSTSFGSSMGSPYCIARLGLTFGRWLPLWQVKQVTARAPPKLSLLMAVTIRIIFRVVCFNGVSSAHFSQLFSLSAVWHSTQFMVRAAEMNPMVSMNSSTGMPLRTWTFLNTSSAIGGLCCCTACPLADGMDSKHTNTITDPNFMLPPNRNFNNQPLIAQRLLTVLPPPTRNRAGRIRQWVRNDAGVSRRIEEFDSAVSSGPRLSAK